MTMHSERLLKNVSRWAPDCPKQSTLLLELCPERIAFCETANGEPNLKEAIDGVEKTFHSAENAAEEAEEWFRSLNLYQSSVIFVYGVGAGHYFNAAKSWLEKAKEHRLVFLEDDLEVVYHLFNSEIGRNLLTHDQTFLYFLERGEKGRLLESSFGSIPAILFLHQPVFSSLKLYEETKPETVEDCRKLVGYYKNFNTFQLLEQLTYGRQFFANYYRNLLELSESKFADRMFEKFQGVPAIICGAGPSLEKNRALLETLSDHALVIAGGSSMNVVNADGWLPHFGIAVDPNLSQYSRLFMNQGYEVPYFFRNRVFPEALRLLHGEHLYVSGSGGYQVAGWFEEQLGIEGKNLEEGSNVVNFGIAIAASLGCSPIILVGVDMAYTEGKSYASGILPHPILDLGKQPKTRSVNEQVVEKDDINGNPVQTLWKWIQESVWISQFCITKPEIKVINATEGGIGVEAVPNVSLEEVKNQYLKTQVDLEALIHVRVQESIFEKIVDSEVVADKMRLLVDSLKKCKHHCSMLIEEFNKILEVIEQSDQENPKLITDIALQELKLLNQEAAFKAILARFNESFLSFYGREDMESLYKEQDKRIDQKEINLRRTQLNLKRYHFLKAVCKENIERIMTTLKEDRIRHLITEGLSSQHADKEDVNDAQKALERISCQTYEVNENAFRVEDAELGVAFEGKLDTKHILKIGIESDRDRMQEFVSAQAGWSGKVEFVDNEGRVVSDQFYQSGKLHGPSRGYFSNGQLACQTFYLNGSKHGKSVFYDCAGSLYAIKGYRNGKRSGKQESFYPNGNLKFSSYFLDGQLDGLVCQYFSSRVLKRKINFIRGKRHGKEIIWNLGGIKEIEINYIDDKPIGFSRSWHLNGQLAREIFYDENGKVIYVHGWSSDGVKLPADLLLREDYFEKVSNQAGKLAGSIEEIIGHVSHIVPELNRAEGIENADAFASEMKELVSEMDHLREVYQQIESFREETTEGAKEALWKTPETQKILGSQLDQIAEQMSEDIQSIEQTLQLMDQLLKHPKDKNGA